MNKKLIIKEIMIIRIDIKISGNNINRIKEKIFTVNKSSQGKDYLMKIK
jgi:hypothetical protein